MANSTRSSAHNRSNDGRIGSVQNCREWEMKMATVAVRTPERMPAQADANGRVRERYIDAAMTRAAREARIAWRMEHLAAWQHDLESLVHFDPDYPYDIAHGVRP